jgi:hypothetical protein
MALVRGTRIPSPGGISMYRQGDVLNHSGRIDPDRLTWSRRITAAGTVRP